MSMTKRYLESLPAEQQDDILGLPADGDWTDFAENKPTQEQFNEWMRQRAEAESEPTEETWPEEKGDEQCLSIFEQVEQAPLQKPRGKCVLEKAADGTWWKV